MKIVSLVPSASEIICDLGLEKNLVGVSHECNYPISLQKINTVTSSNIDSAKSQREIDKSVRVKVNENSPLYDCLLYTSPSPRDVEESRMPSSA